jgi:membrane-associated phospholipid phosphatase
MGFDDLAWQRAVTGFGDIAVVGPVAAAIALWLMRCVTRSAALRFAWPVAASFVAITLLKMVMRAAGGAFGGSAFALSAGAPSGHMAMSTVVYGGLSLVLLKRGCSPFAVLAAVVTVLLLAGIAVTRVTLHAHLPADVAAGLLIGCGCAVWMGKGVVLPARIGERDIAVLLLIVVVTAVATRLTGLRIDSAKFI